MDFGVGVFVVFSFVCMCGVVVRSFCFLFGCFLVFFLV